MITYSIFFGWLISPGQFRESVCSGASTGAGLDVPPGLAAGRNRGCSRQRLLNGVPQLHGFFFTDIARPKTS